MEWSGHAGIGINADGGFYINHNFSRSDYAKGIACLNFPESNWSNVLYQLRKCHSSATFIITPILIHFIDGNYLPFIKLSESNVVSLPSILDSTSRNISIPGGLAFGSRSMDTVSVSIPWHLYQF